MTNTTQANTFVRLANKDEALRVSLLLLVNDPSYQMLPMRQITTFYRSISSNNYLLMLQENRAVAVIMWMEISAEVSKECLINDRSPLVAELKEHSHAIYCIGFASVEPGALLPLWKSFAKTYANRDILIKRHFKGGKPKTKPTTLIRNQKKISELPPL